MDLYQIVTDKILESLESGVAPWVKPWKDSQPFGGMPYNALSGKPYRGINVALLLCAPYPSQGWLTYKQAQQLGGQVRKGEKGSMIVFFKPFTIEDKNGRPDSNGNLPSKQIPLLRHFTVFNVAQIDGLPARMYESVKPTEAPDCCEHLRKVQGLVDLRHGGNRAYYSIQSDYIAMPQPDAFGSADDYFATLLHEVTHWTGHHSRLAREYGKRFGDTAYAREELVAEMGSAFLCAHVGLDGRLIHASASYLQSWIDVLKADKRAIVVAAAAAQKAADYVLTHAGVEIAEEAQEAA